MLTVLVALFAITAAAAAARTDPTLKLDFTQVSVPREIAAYGYHSTFTAPLVNNFTWQKFTIDVAVGTPPQSFKVMLDTGSADLWVPSPQSRACAPNCPFPTFDKDESKTYRDTGLLFNATYGLTPDLALTGPYFNDTVRLGPAVLPGQTLALGDLPTFLYDVGNFGIMGLGPPTNEALVSNPASPYFQQFNKTYPVVYERLFEAGYIKKQLFSLGMNSKFAKTGSILFGGVDQSKYHGSLQYVPLIGKGFPGWQVNLNSVVLCDSAKRINISSTSIVTVLDSGSPNMYLPVEIANAFSKSLNATMVDGYNGPFPYVDCNAGKDQYLEFAFDAGIKIRVPASDVIYPFGDPANVGEIRDSSGQKLCYLGLQGTPGPIFLLGNTFQRSAYLVFDVDNLRVGMAPIRY